VALPELLRDAGYHTYHVGKWHLGGVHGGWGPHEWGFERTYGIYAGGSNHWNASDMLPNTHTPSYKQTMEEGKVPPLNEMLYFEDGRQVQRPLGIDSDDLYTSKMIEYLESNRGSGDPFFAYVAFTTAHLPIQAPSGRAAPYIDLYASLGFEKLKRARYNGLVASGIVPEDAPFPPTNPIARAWDSLSREQQNEQAFIYANYAAMIESQDFHIGRLLDYLRETGELDNTLVVYMTDNGPEGTDAYGVLGNSGLQTWMEANFSSDLAVLGTGTSNRQIGIEWANASTGGLQWWKWFVTEGGIRVPLIVKPAANFPMAGIAPGDVTRDFATVHDLPMTLLEYTGVNHPGDHYHQREIVPPAGQSMMPFLNGTTDRPRPEDAFIHFELFGNAYVVKGNYKAIKVRTGMWGDGTWHLYDTVADPAETQPLEDKMPELLTELVGSYEAYATPRGIMDVADDWNPMKELGH